MDDLGFIKAVDRLGERIVLRVADAADRGFDAGLGETIGIFNRDVLHARTPFCLSSGNSRGVDFLATLRDEREDLSRKVAFQGSNGVEFGMPFCYPAGNVILGSLVGP